MEAPWRGSAEAWKRRLPFPGKADSSACAVRRAVVQIARSVRSRIGNSFRTGRLRRIHNTAVSVRRKRRCIKRLNNYIVAADFLLSSRLLTWSRFVAELI